MAYTKYSLTPADNNAAPPNGAPEGMLPSGVNDTMRDMMSQIRDVGDGIRDGTYTMTAPKITGGSITGVTYSNIVITGGSITGAALSGNTFTNPVISGGSINNTPIGATTATTATFTTATVNRVEDSQGGSVAPISSVMRNRIINGAMVIDQRNAGASVTPADGAYTLDRFIYNATQSSKVTIQQNAGSVTPPAGFTNYLGITSSSAYSVGSGDFFTIGQRLEGFNTADLDFGKSTAKTITLSFWVRSSLTGTFGGAITNSALNRSYPFTYTISAANTWEYETITIAGDTSGTWLTTNETGMRLYIGLGVGSTYAGTAGAWTGTSNILGATGAVNVVGTNGATFYITGVQLEKGTQATSFEYRQYGTELALCQRYFQSSFPIGTAPAQNAGGTGAIYCQGQAASSPASCQVVFPVQMRTTPSTFTTFNPSAANANWRNITASSDITVSLYSSGATGAFISSIAQVMNQYAVSGIHYSASSEL
jgi:hypothetical protein